MAPPVIRLERVSKRYEVAARPGPAGAYEAGLPEILVRAAPTVFRAPLVR